MNVKAFVWIFLLVTFSGNLHAEDSWACEAYCVTQIYKEVYVPTCSYCYGGDYYEPQVTYRASSHPMVASANSMVKAWRKLVSKCEDSSIYISGENRRMIVAESFTYDSAKKASMRQACFRID